MERFDKIFEQALSKCNYYNRNKHVYEQYVIENKDGKFVISENNKVINTVESFKKAKELCDSISSGC